MNVKSESKTLKTDEYEKIADGVEHSLAGNIQTKKNTDDEAANSIERSLSEQPIPVRGILLKRRDFFIWDWRAHYFVIDEDEIQCYTIPDESPKRAMAEESKIEADGMLYTDSSSPKKILKLPGLSVKASDRLSKPKENLYVFTINSTAFNDPLWVLGAASEENRKHWMTAIESICGRRRED